MVVKCSPDERHPIGYLHVYFDNNKGPDSIETNFVFSFSVKNRLSFVLRFPKIRKIQKGISCHISSLNSS